MEIRCKVYKIRDYEFYVSVEEKADEENNLHIEIRVGNVLKKKKIVPQVFLVDKDIVIDYDYDYDDNLISDYSINYYYHPIKYNPVTGKKIKIITEEVIDLTETIDNMRTELSKLNQKKKTIRGTREYYKLYDKYEKELKKYINPENILLFNNEYNDNGVFSSDEEDDIYYFLLGKDL